MHIRFSFVGKKYVAGMDFYNKDRVVLPDHTVLEVRNGWIESLPPKPRGLRRSKMRYEGTTKQIARQARAAVARET